MAEIAQLERAGEAELLEMIKSRSRRLGRFTLASVFVGDDFRAPR